MSPLYIDFPYDPGPLPVYAGILADMVLSIGLMWSLLQDHPVAKSIASPFRRVPLARRPPSTVPQLRGWMFSGHTPPPLDPTPIRRRYLGRLIGLALVGFLVMAR